MATGAFAFAKFAQCSLSEINLPFSEGKMTQSPVWHYFLGGDMFCMKLCDASAPDAMGLCEHIYDKVGCGPNVPAAYKENVFESCVGDDQKPVNPTVFDIPASSQCTPYESAKLFTSLVRLMFSLHVLFPC